MQKNKQGYKKLIVWQNAFKLRQSIYQITKRFPRTEFRRISQMRDAARSIKQNIQEGYMRNSLGEYIHFLSVSQGSLGELWGDVEDCHVDGLIKKEEFEFLNELLGKTAYLLKRLIQALEAKRAKLK